MDFEHALQYNRLTAYLPGQRCFQGMWNRGKVSAHKGSIRRIARPPIYREVVDFERNLVVNRRTAIR